MPQGWSPPEGPRLVLDEEIRDAQEPPLPHPDGAFALIEAPEAFTRLGEGWAEWALELKRLLAPNGIAVVGLADPAEFDRLTGERWDEEAIGISVLPSAGATRVFHSDWWIRAHLGRAFELAMPETDAEGRSLALRSRPEAVSPEDLREPESGEPRELVAAHAEVERLQAHCARLESRHRRELDALREELGRELMRKAFQATSQGAGLSIDPRYSSVAAYYEATRSWRITKPLRRAGQLLRRFR
jgi:hypothetical protein